MTVNIKTTKLFKITFDTKDADFSGGDKYWSESGDHPF